MPGYITDFILRGIQNVEVEPYSMKMLYSPNVNWNLPLININQNIRWITNNINGKKFPLQIPIPASDTLNLKILVDYYYNILLRTRMPCGRLSFDDILYLDDRLMFIIKVDKL